MLLPLDPSLSALLEFPQNNQNSEIFSSAFVADTTTKDSTNTDPLALQKSDSLAQNLLMPVSQEGSYINSAVNNSIDLVDNLNAFNLSENIQAVSADGIPIDSASIGVYQTDMVCSVCQMKLPSLQSLSDHKCFKSVLANQNVQSKSVEVANVADIKNEHSKETNTKVCFYFFLSKNKT